uniref:Uncharacterized protein n=1 Tax=Arundo donax TaxID=35708 RepID=A0A0A8ZUZ1_ARUDO
MVIRWCCVVHHKVEDSCYLSMFRQTHKTGILDTLGVLD